MRYFNIIMFSCLAFLASCSASNALQTASTPFTIEKEAINKGILRIHLPENRPKCLAIQSPNGEWYVLQDSEESIEIMPQERFDLTKEMEFKINELKGVTWKESKKVDELIFKTSGNYLIYFADNLETEPENTFTLQETISFKKH